LTLTEVSSEHTTGLASTTFSIAAVAASSGSRARDVADRALADREAEQFVHQQSQPLHADGMGIMQVDHHGGDGLAERRSRLQPGRGFG
jgi:hypothetical protein